MPEQPNVAKPIAYKILSEQPEDSRSFTLYTTVREVSFIPQTRERPFSLSRVKCDSFGSDREIYPGSGSLHFYFGHEDAPKVGEMLEISVRPWNGTTDGVPVPVSEE